jgi:hypothetical protein
MKLSSYSAGRLTRREVGLVDTAAAVRELRVEDVLSLSHRWT